MKDYFKKVMQLINRNNLNSSGRYQSFGKHSEVEFYWVRGKDLNEEPLWYFKFKGEKERHYFSHEDVLEKLEYFQINKHLFLAYLESIVLNEVVYMSMASEEIEKVLGQDRIKGAKDGWKQFSLDLKKILKEQHERKEKEKKDNTKATKTIRIKDS